MLTTIYYILLLITTIAGGMLFSYFYLDSKKQKKIAQIKQKNENLIEKARAEAATLVKEAKDYLEQSDRELSEELSETEKRLQSYQDRLSSREKIVDTRFQNIEEADKKLSDEEATAQKLKAEIQDQTKLQLQKLEEKTGTSVAEAKNEVIARMEEEVRSDFFSREQRVRFNIEDVSEQEARNIVTGVLQKMEDKTSRDAIPYMFTIKPIERDKLIGEAGKTLRLLEELTQAELMFDDANSQLYVGGYNLVNRSVAKLTVQTALKKRQYKDDQIRNFVERAKESISKKMIELGQETVKEFGLKDFDPKLVKLIGRMYYRTSFGQNILKHAREVTYFSILMAAELGADIEVCKRAGILHDIGKAVDTEIEGAHDDLTKEICEKFGMSAEITYAAYNHHEKEEMTSIEARIIQVADAISASRPGARQESLDKYLERLQQLEKVSNSFPGIEKSFAIQAGREVRVMVNPEEVTDEAMLELAKKIAAKIEEEVNYPGEVKVNLSRETKSTEYAK
ncbi:MAG: Rnase Y domain-containing protein [Candidatus Gracilibacteria bacterium]|nr:Rnase Y domain-containing protein [Candidatus Gracilibacteria bacterium]